MAEIPTGQTSDGYHTFDELYEHRIALYLTLCRLLESEWGADVWKSRLHSDGSGFDGWFVLGVYRGPGDQITYHLPMSRWNDAPFAVELDRAPEFDGHTSADVIERIERSLR